MTNKTIEEWQDVYDAEIFRFSGNNYVLNDDYLRLEKYKDAEILVILEALRTARGANVELRIHLDLCEAELAQSTSEHKECVNRIDELGRALIEAVDDIESWASYVDDYFTSKHNLNGAIEKYRVLLNEGK